MQPTAPQSTATAALWAEQVAQQARLAAAVARELARYAADPEAYERELQAEDERQAAEHDAAR